MTSCYYYVNAQLTVPTAKLITPLHVNSLVHNEYPTTLCRINKKYFWNDTDWLFLCPLYFFCFYFFLMHSSFHRCLCTRTSMHYLYLYKNVHIQQKTRNLIWHQYLKINTMCKIIRHRNKFWIIHHWRGKFSWFFCTRKPFFRKNNCEFRVAGKIENIWKCNIYQGNLIFSVPKKICNNQHVIYVETQQSKTSGYLRDGVSYAVVVDYKIRLAARNHFFFI